jgi:predicted ATPase/class 3 adenylate cyclase
MSELPTGTVTFLFTDIEGSTRLWETYPEEMQGALARHDSILRDEVLAHGGHIVKTTGDGIHAVFAQAADAVVAAVAAQRTLSETVWTDVGDLRVRMGMHTGSAEHRDGDYYGPALNRAARIMAAAHGGQLLVSLATEELARDALDAGLRLVDLGEHRMRDLGRPERVFQVGAPGLPETFPPLRSLENLPGNLPPQLTSFVGRDQDVSAVKQALRESRLVTLTGVGGVGKTRLAIQVAGELTAEFDAGAWVCELAPADDPDVMAQVVATSLRVQPRPGMSALESIADYLRAKNVLVVLDNCEHLLDPAANLAEMLLTECAAVRVLATSREGLGVAGEQVRPLRSLTLPSGSDSGHDLASSDAVRLFVERARLVAPGFELTDQNATSVAEVCRRLDGIPLAIELAAARVAVMSPGELAQLLDQRFRVLTGGRRRSVERHQTLRAAIDWSYALLSERERSVFDRLSVFVGGFDTDAVRAVVSDADLEPFEANDALGELVAKSMVVAEPLRSGTRYVLLETLRQYGREKLELAGDSGGWRRRHAEHYANFAERTGPLLRSSEELAWRPRVEAAVDNLRAAFSWAIESDRREDAELAMRIVAALISECVANRQARIGEWAEQAATSAFVADSPLRPTVLVAAAYGAWHRGDIETAGQYAHEAVSSPAIPDVVWSFGYGLLGNLASTWGEFGESMRLCRVGLDGLADHPDAIQERQILHSLMAIWYAVAGHFDEAQRLAELGLEEARQQNYSTAVALALHASSLVAFFEGDLDLALRLAEESIALTDAGASDVVYGNVLAVVASILASKGDRVAAIEYTGRSISHSHAIGDRPILGGPLHVAVILLAQSARYEAAVVLEGALVHGYFADVAAPVSAHDTAERQRVVDDARAHLGNAFEPARRQGATMGYEEAVAFTLSSLADLPLTGERC